MKTAYSPRRADFTRRAHEAAERQVYPRWFRGSIAFEDTTGVTRDLDYAIDCQVSVDVTGLRAPLHLSIQERFREPKFRPHGDITITEWNLASNAPSELHKFAAQLFVYGFYDEQADRIVAAKAFSVARILAALSNDEVRWKRQSRVDQSFIAIPVLDLDRVGAVLFSYPPLGVLAC